GCQTTNDTPRRTPRQSQLIRAQMLILLQLLALSTPDSQDCLSQGYTAAVIRRRATCLPCQVDALSQLHSIPIKISQPTCVDLRSQTVKLGTGKLHGGQVNAATNSRYHRGALSASFIMRCQTIDNKDDEDDEDDEAPGH
ncbi:hypothetical protein M5D96_004690, partial [Drosophila gunungcola]